MLCRHRRAGMCFDGAHLRSSLLEAPEKGQKVGRRESYCYPNHPCFPFHDLSDPLQDAREQQSGSARSPPGSPCSKSILRRPLAKQDGKSGDFFWGGGRLMLGAKCGTEEEGEGKQETVPREPRYTSPRTRILLRLAQTNAQEPIRGAHWILLSWQTCRLAAVAQSRLRVPPQGPTQLYVCLSENGAMVESKSEAVVERLGRARDEACQSPNHAIRLHGGFLCFRLSRPPIDPPRFSVQIRSQLTQLTGCCAGHAPILFFPSPQRQLFVQRAQVRPEGIRGRKGHWPTASCNRTTRRPQRRGARGERRGTISQVGDMDYTDPR